MRIRQDKWTVYGTYGGSFTNLAEAKQCAKEASKTPEHDYESEVVLIESGMYYIDYANGKCIRDGWTIKRRK